MDLDTIHNCHEKAVLSELFQQLEQNSHLRGNDAVLADVACVALNRLPARYIRHDVDLAFFQTERERSESERVVQEAVEFAYGFVQARNAMRARR